MLLYKWALVIPESVSITFHTDACVWNFLGFGELEWHPLHFWLLVMDVAFISAHYALQEAVTFYFLLYQKFLASVHASLLLFGESLI
jgi:hypothetical protein